MLFGLADCNSFFCSCERVFRPDLQGKPVVVLSNNDGCIVALTSEAKALGLHRGDVFFQVRDVCEKSGVAVFSSNYTLYGDMSSRVMSLLRSYTPHFDIYSIDEGFLDFSDWHDMTELQSYGQEIVRYVTKGTGIPISLGIAPTKTLAKIASKFAKKYPGYKGCCLIDTAQKRETALRLTPVGDVWGIGRQSAKKLAASGVETAYDLTQRSETFVRNLLHKPGVQTWQELRGKSCICIDDLPEKQSICTSRSFADKGIGQLAELKSAMANFANRTAEKLRAQKTVCSGIYVFFYTSRFNESVPSHYVQRQIQFNVPTSAMNEIVPAVLRVVESEFREGCFYKKGGVIAYDIVKRNPLQTDLFDPIDRPRQKRLQEAIDVINRRNGYATVCLAAQLPTTPITSSDQYSLKRDYISPQYTTDINQIIRIKT